MSFKLPKMGYLVAILKNRQALEADRLPWLRRMVALPPDSGD